MPTRATRRTAPLALEALEGREVPALTVQFDFSYLAGEKEAKHIGVILTPDAAYALAERLLDYAEIAEANS